MAGDGMGAAWERHDMCESALPLWNEVIHWRLDNKYSSIEIYGFL